MVLSQLEGKLEVFSHLVRDGMRIVSSGIVTFGAKDGMVYTTPN